MRYADVMESPLWQNLTTFSLSDSDTKGDGAIPGVLALPHLRDVEDLRLQLGKIGDDVNNSRLQER